MFSRLWYLSFPLTAKTSSQTKKRKAIYSVEDDSLASRKVSKITQQELAADLPATPQTELASPSTRVMDSDDDFMSDASSQGDFDGTQDSDGDVSIEGM